MVKSVEINSNDPARPKVKLSLTLTVEVPKK